MNNIKQIREQFDLITEKEEKEDRKLSALVRAGLYDAKKLPALKKALEKSADKITSQEKRMLVNLLDSLISQVVSDDQVYRKVRQNVHNVSEAKMDTYSKFDPRYKAGYPTDKEMPSVLILKRKAIRVYPDNQKVALYYSQALDKYVTIPYNDIQMGLNEAKKPKDKDDDKKTRPVSRPRPGIRRKNVSQMRSAINTAHMVNRNAEYETLGTEVQHSREKGYSPAVTAGGVLHSYLTRRKLQGSKDKVQKTLKTAREKLAAEKAAKAASTPSPAPASVPKAEPPKPPKMREGKALQKASGKIKDKNGPSHEFAKGAHAQAAKTNVAIEENFKLNLQMIREQKLQEYSASDAAGDAADILIPGVSAYKNFKKGNYGAAARDAAIDIGSAIASVPTGGAAWAARSAIKAGIKGAGKLAAKGTTKAAGKGLTKGSRLARGARKVARGAAGLAGALSGTGGGGSDSSSSSSSGGAKHNFTAKIKTVEPPNRTNLPSATEKRRQSDSDRANSKLAKSQANESSVLDTIKSIVENNIPEKTIQFNENKITINNTVAKKLLNVYESVNKTNKKKMEQMLNENATSFNKVLTFAVRQ